MLPWQPVIEEDFGHTRFLTDQPETFFKDGNFARVNVMSGVSVDEFTSPVVGKASNCGFRYKLFHLHSIS